jgi:serine/threonine protein kinase/tetratricopeptide (TPR) repeat protein
MSASSSGADRLGALADEFLERYRRGERPALTEYTARHPELADRIRELFPALEMLEDGRPEPQRAARAAAPDGPLQRLGEYRIVREIGRGGMGVVYEAEQESLRRRVALKVLPPGALGDVRHVERFQREARAAARLHHTNIVPIFAVGEERGTHYYVMQYIEGQPLDGVLVELRRLRAESHHSGPPHPAPDRSATEVPSDDGATSARVARSLWQGVFRAARPPDAGAAAGTDEPPQPRLGPVVPTPLPRGAGVPAGAPHSSGLLSDRQSPFTKRVALLGVQVADALEYAAGQGVLHRDIKPANLLLDVWGTVWLTDFGLAKATGNPDLTRPGDVLGTLRYLAPERFHGQADVRSDVYALGLTLYEVLALRPAFDGHDQAELTQKMTGAPRRLDRIDPRLPRDLVTIVHKAMAKEPGDRYQTAAALADDLRRFLDDRSIVARRVSLPEQTWRWCRRHPSTAALLAALCALLILASGAGLWYAQQRAEERERARQVIEAALEQLPGLRRQGRWAEANAVLTQAASRLDDAGSDDLALRLRQAAEEVRMAAQLEEIWLTPPIKEGDFDYRSMAEAYTCAFEDAGLDVQGDEDTAVTRIRGSDLRGPLVMALDHWALVADALKDYPLRARLLLLAQRADPDPEWGDRIRDPKVWADKARLRKLAEDARERLGKDAPGRAPPIPLLTLLAKKLGQQNDAAEPLLRAAQWRHPDDFWLNYQLAETLRERKPAEAVSFYRAALGTRPTVAAVHRELGFALLRQGLNDEAILAFRKASELKPSDAGIHVNLAMALLQHGRTAEASVACRKVLEINPENPGAHHNLGICFQRQGRLDEAISEFRRALELDPTLPHPHLHLGICLRMKGQLGEAMTEFQHAIELDPKGELPHRQLGACWHMTGQIDKAMGELQRAVDLAPKNGATHYDVGLCLVAQGHVDEAMAAFLRSIECDPKGAPAHNDLGVVLLARDRVEKAIAEFRKATEFDASLAVSYDNLADALLRRGRVAEARTVIRRGLDLLPSNEPIRKALSQKLKLCERLTDLDAQLPAILQGKQTSTPSEKVKLARFCLDHGRPYAAARLYSAAFGEPPVVAKNLVSGNRYDAARAASRAATDISADPPLDKPMRAELRRQALDWLRAELAVRAKRREAGELEGWSLATWQKDADLAGVRDEARLAELPTEERKEWRRLWADLAALIDSDPLEQGRRHAARREWAKAAEEYARALKVAPMQDGHFWFEYAALLLLTGDRPGYVGACARMVEGCGKKSSLRAYHVARACTLAPVAIAEESFPGSLVDKELNATANAKQFWSLTEQGALHYRAGRFAQAADLFEQSLQANYKSGRAVLNWLWLALTEQRLGKVDEARRWLGLAQTWLDRYGNGMPDRADDELGLHLHNWLEAHVLRAEAEALLAPAPVTPK